jgi:hypothetical protein
MTIPRTPLLFWVEIDASISIDGGPLIPLTVSDVEFPCLIGISSMGPALHGANEPTETIGHVAKQLHILAHHEPKHNKAFVRRTKTGYYDFGFRRYFNDQIVATLTALTDHRVRVDYHDGRESEILYL